SCQLGKLARRLRPERRDDDRLAFHISQFAQALTQRLELLSVGRALTRWEKSYLMRLPRLLRLGDERRKNQAEGENDREPDPVHRHLSWDGWRESSRPARQRPVVSRLGNAVSFAR